jgi:hypothetical protein
MLFAISAFIIHKLSFIEGAHVIIMPNTNQRTRSTVEDVRFATQSKMSQ